MPADPRPAVQVFGRADSRETQKALRFFKERRVPVHYVDVARKPPALGELRRFAQRLGVAALVDSAGRRYGDLGLAYLRSSDDELLGRLAADPALLRLPLVRSGSSFSAGLAEPDWTAWIRGGDTAGPDASGRTGRS